MNKFSNLIPMLAITGDPDELTIKRLLKEYNSVNIKSILLYPRTGCEIEYLSEHWFDVLQCFIENGKKYNMNFWLYDEMNWPSGSCNGLITDNPKFRLKALVKNNGKVKVVSGLSEWENRVCPDVLNYECVDEFIKETHEKYKKYLGKYFGKEITGFFTDEPGYVYSAMMFSDDFNESIPYYDGMKKDFYKLTEKNLFDEFNNDNKNYEYFYEIIVDLLKNRFNKTFVKKINNWCEKNNLIMTGHFYNESPINSSVKANGNVIEQMSGETMPGMDDIWTKTTLDGIEWGTLSCINSAINHKNTGGMAELFALGPCDMNFTTKMKMIAICSAHKVDYYFLAVSPADIRGNVKKDQYFNIFTSACPWFKGLKYLEEFAEKCSEFANEYHKYNIKILYPYKYMAKLIGSKDFSDKFSENFIDLLKLLVNNQISFVFENEDIDSHIPFIYFEDGLIKEKKSKKVFKRNSDFIDWISGHIENPVKIVDKFGKKTDNVFVRISENYNFVIVDLDDKRTDYEINIFYNGYEKNLVLNGVYIGNFFDKFSIDSSSNTHIKTNMTFTPMNYTPYRPFFKDKNLIKFYSDSNKKVKILVRNFDKKVNLKLNNKLINVYDKCNLLPCGVKEFYLEGNVLINEGENFIECNSESEINYFPSVIIMGEFDLIDNYLYDRREKLSCPKVFYGKCKFDFSIKLPENKNMKLKVYNNNYYSELCINGEKTESSVNYPQIFQIPHKFAGKKIDFCLYYYSSISGIMGNIENVLPDYESCPDKICLPDIYLLSD